MTDWQEFCQFYTSDMVWSRLVNVALVLPGPSRQTEEKRKMWPCGEYKTNVTFLCSCPCLAFGKSFGEIPSRKRQCSTHGLCCFLISFPIHIVTNPTSVSQHNSVTSWTPPEIWWAEYLLACVACGPLWCLHVSLLFVQTDGKKCEGASGSGLVGLPPVLICSETLSVGIRFLRLRNQKGPGWLPSYCYQTFWGITWQSWMWLLEQPQQRDYNIQYLTC